jgi:hypothetical protein
MPAFFTLGASSGEHVTVEVVARLLPNATDFWDGNWLDGRVEVRAGGFTGAYRASFRTTDFAEFAAGLGELYERLTGSTRFDTMEKQLQIDIEGDGRGHFLARCAATDVAGVGNRLQFDLGFDQTQIPGILSELAALCREYPVLGSLSSQGHG